MQRIPADYLLFIIPQLEPFQSLDVCELYNARPSARVESIGNRTAPIVFLRSC
jgi:hypothetical protein